jgi:hypothetical protein
MPNSVVDEQVFEEDVSEHGQKIIAKNESSEFTGADS